MTPQIIANNYRCTRTSVVPDSNSAVVYCSLLVGKTVPLKCAVSEKGVNDVMQAVECVKDHQIWAPRGVFHCFSTNKWERLMGGAPWRASIESVY